MSIAVVYCVSYVVFERICWVVMIRFSKLSKQVFVLQNYFCFSFKKVHNELSVEVKIRYIGI